MAYLVPNDLTELAMQNAHAGELATLPVLRDSLPPSYTVYHGVHWSRGYRSQPAFGEIDFVIVNNDGAVLLIEQKNGVLRETEEGLWKDVGESSKNPVSQIRRSLNQVLGKFQWIHGEKERLTAGVMVYCPDYRVANFNTVGLDPDRVVDASQADRLGERIQELLPPGGERPSAHARKVHGFLRQTFQLVPDIHAHLGTQQETFTQLSGGLAEVLDRIEMNPLRLRFRAAAGSGKSQVAGYFYQRALEEGRIPLLLCFNRPLANRLQERLPAGGRICTWYQLIAGFLADRDKPLDFNAVRGSPNFWEEAIEGIMGEEIPDRWRFDTLIVDEGQDFKEEWYEVLRLFTSEEADILWMEDPDQNVRDTRQVPLPGFIGYRSPENYRTPYSIARFIQATLDFAFVPANPLPGMGVQVIPVSDASEQERQLGHRLQELVRQGFEKEQIVILTVRGMKSSPVWEREQLGNFSLRRFTNRYDHANRQVFTDGEIRLETVNRFKGQQAPVILLADVDPQENRLAEDLERIYTGMTRASLRLEMLVAEGNPANERFLDQG